jgi:predicted RecB family nuclease
MSPDVSNLPTMAITDQLFEAFVHCPTKCFLQAQDEPPTDSVYTDWVRQQSKSYQKTVATNLTKRLSPIGPFGELLDPADAISASWRCAVDVTVRSQDLESHLHAVERITCPVPTKSAPLVPIRFVRANRPNNVDKLMLTFDALLLSEITERQVPYGRFIHGDDHTSIRIRTTTNPVKDIVERIRVLLQSKAAPDLVLNGHCMECEFKSRCRKKAMEIDELSLFSGMSTAERVRHRRKGIFTINQLSYTFRPRRDPKGTKPIPKPHYFALQALAIREKTIYIHGSPQLPDAETYVYLDIEGLSTSGPYYLAGILVVSRGREEFHSFWADQRSDEITTFTQFVELVSQLPDFRVFH